MFAISDKEVVHEKSSYPDFHLSEDYLHLLQKLKINDTEMQHHQPYTFAQVYTRSLASSENSMTAIIIAKATA